jgi:hypothetical protein
MRFPWVLLALVGLCVVPTPAAGQTITAFGPEGGVNFARLVADPDQSVGVKWLLAPSLGGFVVLRTFGVDWQIEGLYSVKGERLDLNPSLDLQIIYFELPVAVRLSLRRLGLSAFHAFGGPTFAAKLSAKSKDADQSTDISENFESSDVGLTGGVAFQNGRLMITGRYTHGLRNIVVAGQAVEPQTVHNRSFAIMAGWRIR